MRLIDRVIAIVGGLLLIMLVTVILLAPETVMLLISSIADVNLLLRLALVVVVNILILVFMYVRLRGPRKVADTTGLAVKASGALTDVSVESARTLILNGVKNVPDVAAADVKVQAVNGKADVDLKVQVTGDSVHIPNKQKEIDRALRQVINKQLGLQMRGKPRVHISLQGESLPPSVPAVVEKKIETPVEKPAPETKTVAADDDEDTLVEVAKPHGFLGLRQRDEKPSTAETKTETATSDWLSSYDKQKAENEQN